MDILSTINKVLHPVQNRERQINVVTQRLYQKNITALAEEALRLINEDANKAEEIYNDFLMKLQQLQRDTETAKLSLDVVQKEYDTVAELIKDHTK